MSLAVFCLTALSVLQGANSLALPSRADNSPGSVVAGWYTGWHATTGFPLSDVSWDKYNTLIYAFA